MIKATLFDMNGIIIDDEHIHETAFRETVKSYGIDLNHQGYLDCCAGKTDRAGYEQISVKYSKNLPVNELLQQKKQLYLELFPVYKKNYPGVIDLIHALAKKFAIALTSSSSRAEVNLILEAFGINHDFKVTISSDDVTKGKPDPEPYLITTQKLGFRPNECVVIEDSQSGVFSAKRAGCYCIGVTTTHSKEDLVNADYIVGKFSDITATMIQFFDSQMLYRNL